MSVPLQPLIKSYFRRFDSLDTVELGTGALHTGIHKEGNPRPRQRAIRVRRCRHQVRRVSIGKELSDNGRLGDDLAVVGQRRDETAWVDLEILGRARRGKINDLLLKRDAQLS